MQRPRKPAVRRPVALVTTAVVLAPACLLTAAVTAASPARADDPPEVSIFVDSFANEGNVGSHTVPVSIFRSGDTSVTSTVKIGTVNGTAVAPSDYATKAPTLVRFSPGDTFKTVSFTVKGDTDVEADEAFSVHLTAPVNATIGDDTAQITIFNDDSADPPSFSISDAFVGEGDSGTQTAAFVISRSGSTAAAASVKFHTVAGSAVPPGDYATKAPTTVQFPKGLAQKTVMVNIKADLVPEPTETFTAVLTSPVGASISDDTATGFIFDDDSPDPPQLLIFDSFQLEGDKFSSVAQVTVFRQGNLQGTTTVKYSTAGGSATEPEDYTKKSGTLTFRPGQRTKKIPITIKGGTVPEPDEFFFVEIFDVVGAGILDGTAVVSIANDD